MDNITPKREEVKALTSQDVAIAVLLMAGDLDLCPGCHTGLVNVRYGETVCETCAALSQVPTSSNSEIAK